MPDSSASAFPPDSTRTGILRSYFAARGWLGADDDRSTTV
jgi:hypothetical protein